MCWCVQDLQKWPEEVIVCTRAVPDAATRVDSFDFSNLSVVDSFSNQKMKSVQHLNWPSTARCVLLCFVVNGELSQTFTVSLNYAIRSVVYSAVLQRDMDLEAGKWVWMAVLQRSAIRDNQLGTESWVRFYSSEPCPDKVEKGLLATGEEKSLVEAFCRLWAFLSYWYMCEIKLRFFVIEKYSILIWEVEDLNLILVRCFIFYVLSWSILIYILVI